MVFRRGPKEWSKGYLWNLEIDEVTPGDWVHAKVFTERCSLSSDGRYLIASFYSYESLESLLKEDPTIGERWYGNWSSLSLAPSYAPLALWIPPKFHGETGWWRSQDGTPLEEPRSENGETQAMNFSSRISGWRRTQSSSRTIANVHDENHCRLMLEMGSPAYDGTPGSMTRLQEWYFAKMAELQPFYIDEQPDEFTLAFDGGSLVRSTTRDTDRWEARRTDGKVILDFRPKSHQPQWLDLDHRGRVIYGHRGCLWAWEGFPRGKPKLVADLNGGRPEEAEPLGWASDQRNPSIE